MHPSDQPDTAKLTVDQRLVSFFRDGAKIVGLPASVGEIFGLLFASPKPLTMADLVERLNISKGSASQGLKMLRTLGAVRDVEYANDRKGYFEADIELKKLVGGFIREQVRPHMESGTRKLGELEQDLDTVSDPELRAFYENRIKIIQRWSGKAKLVLPLLQKFLGE